MLYSDNYNLKKPQYGDDADVADINFNTDRIDAIAFDNRRISTYMYDETKSYAVGDLVGFEDTSQHIRLYRCLEATTGVWDSTKWEVTTMADEVLDAKASGGSEVIANPTGSATDTLTKLGIDGTVYGIQGGGGSSVIPNPTGTPTADLEKIGIDGTVYGIPTGSEVEANPTDSATDTLEKLSVDGTVYEVGGGSADVTKTASGNPITFSDGADAPLVECKVTISAKQEGSGTPSPTNIRPIVGYDEVNVGVRGKNLAEAPQAKVYSATDGSFAGDSTSYASSLAKVLPNTQYTVSFGNHGSISAVLFYEYHNSDTDYSFISLQRIENVGMATITTPQYCHAAIIETGGTSTPITPSTVGYIQLELGTAATTYEPYKGKTYTLSLGSTRYGGELDVVKGIFTATWGYIASYAGETLPGRWISDRDEYVAGTSPTTGAEVAYELATPTEITLTAEQIRSLQGSNTLTTDADTMEVEYITEDYQPLVDLIEDSSGGGSSIESYTVTTTTSQYGWLNSIADKDGNPLTEDDRLLSIEVLSNTGNDYYIFLPLGYTNNGTFNWIAKGVNVNTWQILASAITVTVRINYIKASTVTTAASLQTASLDRQSISLDKLDLSKAETLETETLDETEEGVDEDEREL